MLVRAEPPLPKQIYPMKHRNLHARTMAGCASNLDGEFENHGREALNEGECQGYRRELPQIHPRSGKRFLFGNEDFTAVTSF